jgi:hypothetical protein
MGVWLAEVLVTNLTYHVNRTRMFGKLSNLVRDGPGAGDKFRIPLDVYGILKQYLTARSEKIQQSDDMALSFQKHVEELAEQLESDVEPMDLEKDGVDESKKLPEEESDYQSQVADLKAKLASLERDNRLLIQAARSHDRPIEEAKAESAV